MPFSSNSCLHLAEENESTRNPLSSDVHKIPPSESSQPLLEQAAAAGHQGLKSGIGAAARAQLREGTGPTHATPDRTHAVPSEQSVQVFASKMYKFTYISFHLLFLPVLWNHPKWYRGDDCETIAFLPCSQPLGSDRNYDFDKNILRGSTNKNNHPVHEEANIFLLFVERRKQRTREPTAIFLSYTNFSSHNKVRKTSFIFGNTYIGLLKNTLNLCTNILLCLTCLF